MFFVLSGEGPTDLGCCRMPVGRCEGADCKLGPMAVLVDQLSSQRLGYSVITTADSVVYLSKSELSRWNHDRKEDRRRLTLRGKKTEKETGFFKVNAWALGSLAAEIEVERNDRGIAVLFRDSDGTHSAPRSLWQDKWESMVQGFQRADYTRGVPMLPKPKSEAWLLCAAKDEAYQHCAALEDLPGNDAAPRAPKKLLEDAFGEHRSGEELCEWLSDQPFDADRAMAMPSFAAFRERLEQVLGAIVH